MGLEKIIFSWSGGKDSALALYQILQSGDYEVCALLTTLNESYDRICMHGVRQALLNAQSESIGIPLEKIYLTPSATNEEYDSKMRDELDRAKDRGITAVAFGDIFLEDLRQYRVERLSQAGMKGIFPIWKRPSSELALAFIRLGFKAVIACVDSQALDKSFAGREFDEKFLSDLPQAVDPCGENGEFHTFVYEGPLLQRPVVHKKGEVVFRDNRFYFCDLL